MDHIDYKSIEYLHPDQALPAPVVRFPAISVIEPPSAGNGRLMVSFRPAFSRPLPLPALLPLFVACGPSDGGITVDEDDVGVETPGARCPVPNMPASGELKAYDKLHDPVTVRSRSSVYGSSA
ncbi:MAG TPA: hypothetical protein VL242_21470 [Sorangium sp.]|nr:hypothetical protein [Sorangium sp.]